MTNLADWNDTHFDVQDWDVIDADDPFLAPFDDREDDGWSERFDYADEDFVGADGEAEAAFWGGE